MGRVGVGEGKEAVAPNTVEPCGELLRDRDGEVTPGAGSTRLQLGSNWRIQRAEVSG